MKVAKTILFMLAAILASLSPLCAQTQSDRILLTPGSSVGNGYITDVSLSAGNVVTLNTNGHLSLASHTAAGQVLGVVRANGSIAATVMVDTVGQSFILTDNACTTGNFIAKSPTVDGQGDCSSTLPATELIGYANASIGSAGLVSVALNIGGGGAGGAGAIAGTPNTLAMFTGVQTIGNSPTTVANGDTISANPTSQPASLYPCTNSASGTTNGLLVTRDANGNCINNPNANQNNIRGVVKDGGGTSGTSQICKIGLCSVILDNTSAINDCIVASTANAQGHDAGPPPCPAGIQQIGLATNVNGGAGTAAQVDVFIFDVEGSPSGPVQSLQVNGVTVAGSKENLNNTTPAAPTNFQDLTWLTDNLTPTSNISLQVPQATTGQAGIVKLAQDFCGTFALPLVCGAQGIPITFSGIAVRDVFCFVTTLSIQNCKLGVPPRLVAGTTDTVLATDRGGWIVADGVALAETVPLAATLGGQNFFFNVTANGSGSVTLTFSGSEKVTKNASSATSSSTLVITAGSWCNITSDVNSTANWYADCNGGGGGGAGTSATYPLENCTPDTSGLVFWTVNALTNWRDGHWEYSDTIASATHLYCKVKIPHVLPTGTADIILFNLNANDATAGHTMTFKTCDIVPSTTINVGALTCTSTQNFTTTATAYAPSTLVFAVQSTIAIDNQLIIDVQATTETGLTANVQLEGAYLEFR